MPAPNLPANNTDAFVPELWAQEALAILEENMVMGNLVYRDFSEAIAAYGDVVNTRKPGEFKSKRKTDQDAITVQAATALNIPVPLDQHPHVSFLVRDGEESKSFQELTQIYLRPAALAIARQVDIILSVQAFRFRKYCAGGLGTLTSTNAGNILIDTRTQMNKNKVLEDNDRQLVLTTVSEGALLKNTQFTDANRVGDDGTALREASLGRKFGFNIFMAQNTPFVPAGASPSVTGAINKAGGYLPGTTTFTVSGFSAAINTGQWIQIAGDDTPLQVVSTVGGAAPTSITTFNPSTGTVANSAVVTVFGGGTINNAAGYPAGYAEDILITGFVPVVGMPVTFGGDNTNVYGIIDTDGSTYIDVDRPLVNLLTNGQTVNVGPSGAYNFAFHRTAIAFVNRPLALPKPGLGALSAIANFNNISMRVVMAYDPFDQGTVVTLDMLMGVAQLEPLNGVLMLG
jgi:hypothetical protein